MNTRPTLYITSNEEGYQCFSKNLLPYMDASMFEELGIVDKWWLTALDHNDNRFGRAILAELQPFLSPSSGQHQQHRATNRAVWPYFDSYQTVVDEVLLAKPLFRQNFISLACGLGNSCLLQPFIDAGFDFEAPILYNARSLNSYISTAAGAGNFETLESLMAAGCRLNWYELENALRMANIARTGKNVERVIDQHKTFLASPQPLYDPFTRSPFSSKVKQAVGSLFAIRLSLSEADRSIITELYRKLVFKGLGSFTLPPYSRTMYLGPEMIYAVFCGNIHESWFHRIGVAELLSLGASLDYVGPEKASKQISVLEWAVELGYERIVKLLVEAESNFEDYEASLRQALCRADECLSRSHPRKWPAECFPVEYRECSEMEGLESKFNSEHEGTYGVSLDTDRRCVKILEDALQRIRHVRSGNPQESQPPTSTVTDSASRTNSMPAWRSAQCKSKPLSSFHTTSC